MDHHDYDIPPYYCILYFSVIYDANNICRNVVAAYSLSLILLKTVVVSLLSLQ